MSHEVFSEVTGERPALFLGVMDGGPPGSEGSRGEQGGGWLPPCITP